jgi:cell division protein FtsL
MTTQIIEWIKINRFKVFGIVAISAILLISYVDNTVKINTLLNEIQQKETEIRNIKAKNEILNSEIIELESAERITKIAEEKLGLSKPIKIPIIIEETEN